MLTTSRTLMAAVSMSLLLALAVPLAAVAPPVAARARWVSGDIHTHTYLTDGGSPFHEVVRNAFTVYGLDYIANSEHGGVSTRDPSGSGFATPVWRWLTLRDYSFPLVAEQRAAHPQRRVLQGVEWNAPTHEHVSVGIVGAGNEPDGISAFEYHFDAADFDVSRTSEGTIELSDPATGETLIPAVPFAKSNVSHEDALVAVDWLEQNYGGASYAIVNHPSRSGRWSVGDFRALNDTAPDVCFGFEGLPGHQAAHARGGYSRLVAADGSVTSDAALADSTLTARARTYGGADLMTAAVGGLWDALLGEGRHWWVFNNSDYHTTGTSYKDASGATIGRAYSDFWPGQYAKTYTRVGRFTDRGIVNGMRSGKVFVTSGELVNGLRFIITARKRSATMGGTLKTTSGKRVLVRISVRSPRFNGNGDRVRLDHVDLIAGDVTGRIPAQIDGVPNPAYSQSETNPSTRVIKTFRRANWKVVKGWKVMSVEVKATKDMYFRLRGTNLAPGTLDQTDAEGNPLIDELDYIDYPNPMTGGLQPDGSPDLIHGNTPANAWTDLWFYANPVFLDVK